MDVVGYAYIAKEARPEQITTTGQLSLVLGQVCRVIEFQRDGDGAIVVNADGSAIAIVDKALIKSSFRCLIFGHFICPPNLDIMRQMEYTACCMSRKGGWSKQLFDMVIAASLYNGKFTDDFLWRFSLESRPSFKY
jgi:hypothetical protein